MVPPDHDCSWKEIALSLERENRKLEAEVERLRKRGRDWKKEKLPSPEQEMSGDGAKPRGGYQNPDKRDASASARASSAKTTVHHPVSEEEVVCPHCHEPAALIDDEISLEVELIPERMEIREHHVEVRRCPCKRHYVKGPAPRRIHQNSLLGPAFVAKLCVDKCADSTPIYRIEKELARIGFPVARSTLNDAYLRAGELLHPLFLAGLRQTQEDAYVQADETSFKVQGLQSRAFVWTFLSRDFTAYVFAESRSGETPKSVLGESVGNLLVDGYTGYNTVTDTGGRCRSGCFSHARRYFFEALPTAPSARVALDLILDLFRVEAKARSLGVTGTAKHLAMRHDQSKAALDALSTWAAAERPLHEPSSKMGRALTYLDNQWKPLTAFLEDPKIAIHNNASEAALRIIALARKNSLFFGNAEAAHKQMVLFSLIATCAMHGVNPRAYIADVLLRIQDTKVSEVHTLLPGAWKERFGSGFPTTDDGRDAPPGDAV